MLFYERYNAGHVGEERIEVAVRRFNGDPVACFQYLQEKYDACGFVDPIQALEDKRLWVSKSQERRQWLEQQHKQLQKQKESVRSLFLQLSATVIQRAWRCSQARSILASLRKKTAR